LAAWVDIQTNTPFGGVIVKAYATNGTYATYVNYEMYVASNMLYGGIACNSGSLPPYAYPYIKTYSAGYSTGWNFVCFSWKPGFGDSRDFAAYINGDTKSMTFAANFYNASTTNIEYSTLPVEIGRRNNNVTPSLYYTGLMGGVYIFDTALSSGQITNLYNDSCTKYGKSKLP
jgi:hypothetical protein